MTTNRCLKTAACYASLYFCITLRSSVASSAILHLDEGDVCWKGEGSYYVCEKPKNCENFKNMIDRNISPAICSFDKSQPIICCPTKIEKSPVSDTKIQNWYTADEMCRKYSALEFPESKNTIFVMVVGGHDAKPREFPHMAILGYGETMEPAKWGCGGSIISEFWILTAAHCLENAWGKARWARLGDLNIASTSDDADPKDYRITRHVLHPDYRRTSRYNDVALFRLEKSVEFSAYARPVCLNTDSTSSTPLVQIATGWGKTGADETTSDVLQTVELDIVDAAECNGSYFSRNDPKLRFGIMADSMLCAGSSSEDDKDTCLGDSGGPLQVRNPNNPRTYIQFGITSFGGFCGNKDTPGVYTRVSKYVSWIQRIVWPR